MKEAKSDTSLLPSFWYCKLNCVKAIFLIILTSDGGHDFLSCFPDEESSRLQSFRTGREHGLRQQQRNVVGQHLGLFGYGVFSCQVNRAFSCKVNRVFSYQLNRVFSCQVNRVFSCQVNRVFSYQVNRVFVF